MGRTTIPVTLSLTPKLLRKVETTAKKEQKSRTEIFREAVRLYLETKEWEKLQKQIFLKEREEWRKKAERVLRESRAYFKSWLKMRGYDPNKITEEEIEELVRS